MNYLEILWTGLGAIYGLGLTGINYMLLLDGRILSECVVIPAGFHV